MVKARKPKWWWVIEYKCGCSDDAHRRKDLLDYCGKHGASRTNITRFPAKRNPPSTTTTR